MLTMRQMTRKPREISFAVVGAQGAGKSALVRKFIKHECVKDVRNCKAGESNGKELRIGDSSLTVITSDTNVQPRDESGLCVVDGYIVVYSITDRESFRQAKNWLSLIRNYRQNYGFPVSLIANKSDLRHQRQITSQQGRRLAIEYGCNFHELSAMCGTHARHAFHELLETVEGCNILKDKNTKAVTSICIKRIKERFRPRGRDALRLGTCNNMDHTTAWV